MLVIGLLIALELLGPTDSPRHRALRQLLRVTTFPLLVVFAVSVGARTMEVLAVQS